MASSAADWMLNKLPGDIEGLQTTSCSMSWCCFSSMEDADLSRWRLLNRLELMFVPRCCIGCISTVFVCFLFLLFFLVYIFVHASSLLTCIAVVRATTLRATKQQQTYFSKCNILTSLFLFVELGSSSPLLTGGWLSYSDDGTRWEQQRFVKLGTITGHKSFQSFLGPLLVFLDAIL